MVALDEVPPCRGRQAAAVGVAVGDGDSPGDTVGEGSAVGEGEGAGDTTTLGVGDT